MVSGTLLILQKTSVKNFLYTVYIIKHSKLSVLSKVQNDSQALFKLIVTAEINKRFR